MDVEKLAKELILKNMTPEQQMAVLEGIKSTVAEAKEVQKRKIGENVDLVVQALKKIEADIRSRYDDVGNAIEKRVASIKDGRDGKDGKDGRDGKDGKAGRDGAKGDKGDAGRDGRDGVDGVDGVSVTSARIDFDGSLIIVLSSGVELNVGEVVAPDLAERIKVITNGGGTSQSVLDTLASLQTQINNLIPSQTGNSGKFLTTNGSALSWASVAGGLSYQGTWNASTNTPTLASSTGTNGYYYIVATAGSTNLNGITDWQVGDWLLFNGTVWQKIDQSETLQFVTSADASVTVTTTGSTADLAVYSSPRLIAQVRNETGATLTKGTVVYINGASGNKATVTKALATSDTTSAQTFGLIFADISNNNNGYAILAGDIAGLDTSAFAAGTQLYLSSSTAGAYTSTKQYAPNHLVYVGVVTRSHANQGSIEVRIQNGYEMDELHNVSAQSPSNGQVLIYNTTTSLWEKANLTAGTAIGVTNGAGSITIDNTGVTSAVAGTGISVSGATGAVTITNSAPDQTVALTGAGTTSVTGTYPNFTITSNDAYVGTVTSVAQTFTGGLISGSGSPITSSGTLALTVAGTSGGIPYFSSASTWASSAALASNALMVGGGAGFAPSTITTGTGVVTALGVNTGSSGAFVVNGGALGTPSSGTVTNLTGTASININGTVGATTANSGAFTTLSATGVTTVQAGSVTAPAITTSGDTNTGIFFPAADTVGVSTGGSERMRIDSSGNLLVGKTATSVGTAGFEANATGMSATNSGAEAANFNRNTSDGTIIIFRRSSSGVGTISVTTTATAYNTSSDYRLKHDIAPMTGALAKVSALNPVTYKWNADDSDGEGFIAHELAEVVPQCVTGEKDAVDAEGNPIYQGIDTSFLVATLTAAIKEQQALIQALTDRITALEAK